ncbi:hypothetical protein BN77_0283 [Rhizobium mesoamericanum STM3625]|uniref:Uncharacterized protein n=1 Tax=Rhizobium mesoamericanum STM3625 TaxID=1211777 RepID=K0PU14_9HYPH|nr:hypothetical protein BN77_0283 [Rhizobium mesoamericanum STM3625]
MIEIIAYYCEQIANLYSLRRKTQVLLKYH